jgi:hypothetical protein
MTIREPLPRAVLVEPSLGPDRSVQRWSDDASLANGPEDCLSIRLNKAYTGVNVWLAARDPVDLSGHRAYGRLEVQLKFSTSSEGLLIGLEDGTGKRTELLADAYTNPDLPPDRPRTLIVPLSDFRGIGRSEGRQGPAWGNISWPRIHKLTLSRLIWFVSAGNWMKMSSMSNRNCKPSIYHAAWIQCSPDRSPNN